jgi:dsDNA-specific endonuclease/ATPase MutS2
MADELVPYGTDAFTVVRRGGYDREEVDARVSMLSGRIAELARRIAELEANRSPEEAVRRALEQVGEEVTGILQRTHETAGAITANAERDALEQRATAAQDAAAAVARAEQRVHELDLDADRIWAERERIIADARELSRQLTELADAAAARLAPPAPLAGQLTAGSDVVSGQAAVFDAELDDAYGATAPGATYGAAEHGGAGER